MGNVSDFQPSRNGLHFPNAWPDAPELTVDILGRTIKIGDAANGLCGGMAYTARDLFEAKQMPPTTTSNPPAGSPPFEFIVHRLFESFSVPVGISRYFELMNLPLADSRPGVHDGLPWVTIEQELPKIRASIDSGHPCPIGIIRVHSADPVNLVQNHQVLVWGYEDQDAMTTLRLYDPNNPNRDDVTITFDHTHPELATEFHFNVGGVDTHFNVLGFFASDYSAANPAALL
jgi:hypothetical protein